MIWYTVFVEAWNNTMAEVNERQLLNFKLDQHLQLSITEQVKTWYLVRFGDGEYLCLIIKINGNYFFDN